MIDILWPAVTIIFIGYALYVTVKVDQRNYKALQRAVESKRRQERIKFLLDVGNHVDSDKLRKELQLLLDKEFNS